MKMKKLVKSIFNFIHSKITHSFLKLLSVIYVALIYLFFGRKTAFDTIRQLPAISIPIVLKAFGAKTGNNVIIEAGLNLHNASSLKNLSIGNNVNIGKNCFLDLRDKITICDDVVISMHAKIITHLDMGNLSLSKIYPNESSAVSLGEGTYIGVSSIILKGVTIGPNCLVAAQSLVDKSFSEQSLIAGTPAELKRKIDLNLS